MMDLTYLRLLKRLKNFDFFISVSFGWFVLGRLWSSQTLNTEEINGIAKDSVIQCACPSLQCPPCLHEALDVKTIEQRNIEVGKGYFRSYRYKPVSYEEDEINRWRLLTKTHNYEMINQESKIGINGMWKIEVNEADKIAQVLLKKHDSEHHQSTGTLEMQESYRHLDPFNGMKYHINYVEKKEKSISSRSNVHLWRPFIGGKPKLIDIEEYSGNEIVNIISAVSQVTERFDLFLDRYEKNILRNPLSGPVRLLFVIFVPKTDTSKDKSSNPVVTMLNRLKSRMPAALIDYFFTEGKFSRAIGLDIGVSKCKDGEIVLFLDVDLWFGVDFLGRVRRNTILGKRAIFPIMYSQYDPSVMNGAAKVDPDLLPLVENKMTINKQTGFWIYYAYGVAALYKKDYLKVGGFRLDIKGWGGEDVDLFKKVVADKDLDAMSIVDPDLIHIYHKRGCDVKLAANQYAMCVGAWAETLGSQLEVATLYLNNTQLEAK